MALLLLAQFSANDRLESGFGNLVVNFVGSELRIFFQLFTEHHCCLSVNVDLQDLVLVLRLTIVGIKDVLKLYRPLLVYSLLISL